jgi:predicted permease
VRQFGNVSAARDDARDAWIVRWLDAIGRDVRLAARALARRPGFAVVATATLALGLGANIAIFRFVDTVLLRDLPVREPHELVAVGPYLSNYPSLRALAGAATDVFASLAARTTTVVNVTARETTEVTEAELVSGTYFETLGVAPALGRLLTADDDGAEGAHAVCVISHGYWQRRFGGSPDAVGQLIRVNNEPFRIVGVTAAGFHGADLHARYDLQIPMSMTRLFRGMDRDSASWTWLRVFGRLAPGVTRETAETIVRARDGQEGLLAPKPLALTPLTLTDARQGLGGLRKTLEDPILVAQILSALVLVMTCANLASLLLARASSRRHEVAVRRALGASRGRVFSQLLAESVLVAAAGAAVGAVVAASLSEVLATMVFGAGSRYQLPDGFSAREVGVVFGAALAAGLSIGVLPAVVATRATEGGPLREATRGAPESRWTGGGLIVAQVMVCLALVFAAGLFARSLGNLRALDLGLDPADVVVLGASPERSGYSREGAGDFYREWLRRARLTPGVESASLAAVTVLSQSMISMNLRVPDAEPRTGPEPNNTLNIVTPDYFRTIGLGLAAGRVFAESDGPGAPPVAIVNERFAEHYWPDRSPIGRRFRGFGRDLEIVGVVRTARYQSVREEPQVTFYVPFEQRPFGSMTLHARVPGDAAAAIAALARTARDIDPFVPVHDVATLADHVDARLANERLLNTLASLFAALALVVAATGLYGLVAYAVARRVREVGIRMAIGARRLDIVSLFVRRILWLVIAGVALGAPLALLVARQFGSLLYGVEPDNVPMLAIAAATLAAASFIAALQPALRATRISPIAALRTE